MNSHSVSVMTKKRTVAIYYGVHCANEVSNEIYKISYLTSFERLFLRSKETNGIFLGILNNFG